MSIFENWQYQVVLYPEFLLFTEGSSTQFKTTLALIGFILWHLWESEYQQWSNVIYPEGVLSMCKKSIVLAQIIA